MPKHILIIYVLVACCVAGIMINAFVKCRLSKRTSERSELKSARD
ncbi:hypothetical protein [Mucilaginibacter oryzae]|nr:hypothetical protein [Mucilaginibacter oryzae]